MTTTTDSSDRLEGDGEGFVRVHLEEGKDGARLQTDASAPLDGVGLLLPEGPVAKRPNGGRRIPGDPLG